MALDKAANFAKSTLSAGYAAGVTSIALVGTDMNLAQWPDPATYGAYNAVWWDATTYGDPADDPNREIVRITAKSSATFTVTRAQEGTVDVAHNTAGSTYKLAMCPTAKLVDDINSAMIDAGTYYGWVTDAPYSATGDGVADDYAAFLAAKAALTHIVVPAGTYKIGTDITFGPLITLEFLDGAQMEPASGKTVTIEGNIRAGNHQIFGGSGTVTYNTGRTVISYDRWDGTNVDRIQLKTDLYKIVESAEVDCTLITTEQHIAIAHGMSTPPVGSDCMVSFYLTAAAATPWWGGRQIYIETIDATNITCYFYVAGMGKTGQKGKIVVWIRQP